MPRPMGRPGNHTQEKSKDFIGSMKRLLKNLKPWKILLYLSLILAASSAILSLISPDKLSDLTDTITEGITPNKEKLETLSIKIQESFNEENIKLTIPKIMSSQNISEEDKQKFNEIISNINANKQKDEMNNILLSIPSSIMNELLTDIEIDDIKITKEDQIKTITLMSKMNEENALEIMNQLPKSVYDLIKPSIDMDKVLKIATLIGSLYLLSAIFSYVQSLSMTTISNNFAKTLRSNISIKINKLPLKYFDSHETGDILSRVTNDVDTIAHNLNQSLATLVSSTTLFIGSVIMMFVTNWIMAITAIVASLLGFSIMFLILGKSQKYFIRKQQELGDLNGYIEEIYSGHNVVKAYNGNKEAEEKFKELNHKLYDSNRKSSFLSGLMMPIMGFVGNFGYVAVCIVGALLVSKNIITFGVIVAFMIYVRLFTNPLSQIAQAMTSLQSTAAASERVFEFLDELEMSDQKEIRKRLDKTKVKGEIEFKNVKFGYDHGKTIINNFSVKVKPGQKIAIVGPTGAGKTTMVNLLMKFYEISGGDIIIDGVSIKELSRENIHELFCMVLQDTWLFDGTIGENIKYNKENVTEADIWNACRTVGVDHFVKTLPGGLML